MMKKSILLLLVFSMVLSAFLMGCSPKEEPTDTPPTDEPRMNQVTIMVTIRTNGTDVGNTTEMSDVQGILAAEIKSVSSPVVAMTFDEVSSTIL